MLHPPPPSTLFPYTTLFRSRQHDAADFTSRVLPAPRAFAAAAANARGAGRDRKSTRLNSSHITISYAVFCLKKKKKTQSNHTKHHVYIYTKQYTQNHSTVSR